MNLDLPLPLIQKGEQEQKKKKDLLLYNIHRCETFNSLVRTRNIFGNKQAPSRDIAQGFSVLEHLRFICAGGSFTLDGKEKYDCISYSCAWLTNVDGMKDLWCSSTVWLLSTQI